ncbi:hypothetical protein B7R54_02690 [Subtercola boreus]|uniref:Uncharacterized protein n=1 Tax=Subtercola boreus TaxID=120213 RepID=A0A3E0VEB6_9MICO|nr:hypothetical protein [Subtercola boreus]RFA08252.1 hypothetical protein B7R54_02690 [Subtercola boreus]TQL54855.1 hypothetical protein FB464_2402 [Subtercola boreus]
MSSTSTHPAGTDDSSGLFALVSADSGARAALAAAYRGPHDVLDAVWWREHPLTPTPGGRTDPAAALPGLKAQAFSRTADGEALGGLFAFEARLRDDARQLEHAILDARPALEAAEARRAAAAGPGSIGGGSPETGSVSAVPPEQSSGETDGPAEPAPGSEPEHAPATVSAETWRRRSLVWMGTSIAVGLLLLVAVGLFVAAQLGSGPFLASAGAGAGAAGAAAGTATASPSLAEGLTIFEDPTLAPSIPPQNIDPYYKPESLRLLGVAASELTVYAVENRIDQPCLLAVYRDGTQSATCVTKQEFAAMGIQLRITSLHIPAAGAPVPTASPAEDVVFWNADGSFGVTSTPR